MRSIRLLLAAVVIGVCIAAAPKPVPLPAMSPEKWQADVDFFAREIVKRHANAFHHVSRADFDAAVARLRGRAATANDDEIIVGLMSLAASIGDAHTSLRVPGGSHRLPVAIGEFSGEYRITAAIDPALVGAKLTAIDGTPIAAVMERLRSVASQDETEELIRSSTQAFVHVTEVLHGLGVVRDPLRVKLATDDGRAVDVQAIAAGTDPSAWPSAAKAKTIAQQNPQEPLSWVWLEPQKTVYVNFRRYDDVAARARALSQFVDAHHAEKVIIDLRQNGGGDYKLGRTHLVNELKARPAVKPYVLIGPRTFSAAMNNAIDFRNDAHAVLVGRTIGERPNSYQENDELVLPNSKLVVSYSTRFYKFVPDDAPNVVRPDREIVASWDDFVAGRDAAVEWVLSQ